MATNTTLPPLPYYTLSPQPSLVPGIRDAYLSLIMIVAVYWLVSLFFHIIDEFDLFPQYRLHTPEEVLKRNPVSRWDVFRDVIIQQVVQTAFGMVLAYIEEDRMVGKESYDVAVWAQRIRSAQHVLPTALSAFGIDALTWSRKLSGSRPILSGFLAGGQYNAFQQTASGLAPAFVSWELNVAKAIYYLGIPAIQFLLAIVIVDTWQYFWHRAMHLNKWLYSKLAEHLYSAWIETDTIDSKIPL